MSFLPLTAIHIFEIKNCMKPRLYIHLWMAVILSMSGIALIFMGFWVAPTGEIDNTVLVAFGEISTFAGALFGIDYTYKVKYKISQNNSKEKEENK